MDISGPTPMRLIFMRTRVLFWTAPHESRVQLEPTATYAVSATTEFIKRCRYVAGVLVQMSQMVAKRELSGTLGHEDRRCFILRIRGGLFGQAGHWISPFVCDAEAPPRLAIHLA